MFENVDDAFQSHFEQYDQHVRQHFCLNGISAISSKNRPRHKLLDVKSADSNDRDYIICVLYKSCWWVIRAASRNGAAVTTRKYSGIIDATHRQGTRQRDAQRMALRIIA